MEREYIGYSLMDEKRKANERQRERERGRK